LKEKSIQILCDAQTNGGLLISIPKDQEIKSSKNITINKDIWEIGEINSKYNEKINII
jgi:selenophosphate synthase